MSVLPNNPSRPILRALCAGLAMLLVAGLTAPAGADAAKPKFNQRGISINADKLFDLSVADINEDGNLDMFSTNHKYRGSLLLGTGSPHFNKGLDRSGLSATADLPYFDDLFRAPEIEAAGLYMWVDRNGFTHIHTHSLRDIIATIPNGRVQGTIRYYGRGVSVEESVGARIETRTDNSNRKNTGVVEFDAGPEAEIVIRAQYMDLPFEVEVTPTFPRSRILLGSKRVHPRASTFAVDLGDRHGVAWADFNQDGDLDAYVANGGNRGAVNRFGELAEDEFFFGDGDGRFTEDIAASKITKGFCRGRYAAPVDYDTDGDLDVFVGCEDGRPLLWNQRRPGQFGSQSHLLGKARVKADLYRWIDLDRDGAPELIGIRGRKVRIYQYNQLSGEIVRKQTLRPKQAGSFPDSISITDIDDDLDPDVFVSSRGGNSLLLNRGGSLRSVGPEKVGLPRRGTVAASFVDFDNDGRTDFHAAPQGLYRAKRDGSFDRTGMLRVGGKARWATSSWFDIEGDGDRDLISLIKRKALTLRKRVYSNKTDGGNWLEVDLVGKRENSQAIGARVTVKTGPRTQAAWVGESEGSRYASGHYRLYFGLGRARSIKSVKVFWPDGSKSRLKQVTANQRLQIEQG